MSLVIQRDTLTVEGPDAAKYLQGQLSNDVAGLAVGASCWTFLLEPSGKLGFLLRALRTGDESFVLDTEPLVAEAAEARLRRFLIRTKVTLAVGSLGVDISGDADADGNSLVGWWGEGTHRVSTDALAADAHVDAVRIAAGWPGAAELIEGIIPGETGLVPVTVSFTKGCYTGQELVARIDSRGNNVPRHLCKVALGGPAAAGDEVIVDGEVKGTVTSVAGLQALAYIHRSIETPAAAMVNGATAEVLSQR
jgi:tRNA-modifying protein YgfZ